MSVSRALIIVNGHIAVGHFAVGYFAVGHFAVGTFRRKDISPYGHFAVWTLRRTDISPYGNFAVWTFRCAYRVGHFAVNTFLNRFIEKTNKESVAQTALTMQVYKRWAYCNHAMRFMGEIHGRKSYRIFEDMQRGQIGSSTTCTEVRYDLLGHATQADYFSVCKPRSCKFNCIYRHLSYEGQVASNYRTTCITYKKTDLVWHEHWGY